MAAEGGDPGSGAVLAVFNCGGATALRLPDTAPRWELILDTTRPDLTEGPAPQEVPAQSVLLLRSRPDVPEGETP